ncbi:hypothetical protein SH139x_001280 [Planctomycetaceae bacterium SH139]
MFDVTTQRLIRQLSGHQNAISSVAFNPKGTRLLSTSQDGRAIVWEVDNWHLQRTMLNPEVQDSGTRLRFSDGRFSPDGELVAVASSGGKVYIHDTETGNLVTVLSGHANQVKSLAFTPDGLTLASGSDDGTLRLWNTATWRNVLTLQPETRFLAQSINFTEDGGRMITTCGNLGTLIWSVKSPQERAGDLANELSLVMDVDARFTNRVRMLSENPLLLESLNILYAKNNSRRIISAALAAVRANQEAAEGNWRGAVRQMELLDSMRGTEPSDWLRIQGLLRLANAYLHEDQPEQAAKLLNDAKRRMIEDGTIGHLGQLRFDLESMPVTIRGVRVRSPAWNAGLRVNDQALKFDETELNPDTLPNLLEKLQSKSVARILFTVRREEDEALVFCDIPKDNAVVIELENELLEEIDRQLSDAPEEPALLDLRQAVIALQS